MENIELSFPGAEEEKRAGCWGSGRIRIPEFLPATLLAGNLDWAVVNQGRCERLSLPYSGSIH
jgi:hypothetical protein